MWVLMRKVGQVLILLVCSQPVPLHSSLCFRTHPMIAEGPANKLAHCASDFVAGSRTPVHAEEKLNSIILLFDLGQSLGQPH